MSSLRTRAFTLFEVMLALGIFAIAIVGLVSVIDTAIGTALDVREKSRMRIEMESRLAYCLADPPYPEKRILSEEKNHGIRIEETLEPWPLKDRNGREVTGLGKLVIKASSGTWSDRAEVLMKMP